MKGKLVVCVAMVGALMMTGCGKKQASAKTPRELMGTFQDSVLKKDKDLFVSCFDANKDQAELLGCMFDIFSCTTDLHDSLVKEYGKDAVKSKGKEMNLSDKNWLDDLQIKEDGDKATVSPKSENDPIQLQRKDGVWKINAETILKTSGNANAATMMKGLSKAVVEATKKAKDKIGKSGYTADRIQKEMEQDMFAAIMGSAPKK